MDKDIFEEHKGEIVKLVLKPNGFVLIGTIKTVSDDCFKLKTPKTEYIIFDKVERLTPIWKGE